VSQIYYTSDALETVPIETVRRYGFGSIYYNAWKPGEMTDTMGMRFGSLPVALFASPADYASELELLVPGAALPEVDGALAESCKVRRASGGWVFVFVPAPGEKILDLSQRVPDCQ
jgi:hypothetical protein